VGLDRSTLLRELGVTVVGLPFELHPEIPVGGFSLADRWGSRYGEALEMYERIEAECAAAGLPFRRPPRVPNTRRALETAEWARQRAPGAFEALDRALFAAHFVDNRPLDDPHVVDELVSAAGADAVEARWAVEAGELKPAVDSAMALAVRIGVRGTPSWLVDRHVLIPGCFPRETFREAVEDRRRAAEGP
jgi:predicted DsbA family dithiol-disulfide isomerase